MRAFFVGEQSMTSIKGRYEKDSSGDWVVYDDVPIFDEHVGDDGVNYDARLLSRIAKNNNERIEDTGDYCPIVAWHTPEDKDPSKDPPTWGLAGPFRLGKIGKKKPRWAIFAKFRIRPEHDEAFRRRPRRSVEIWPEDKPESRYIDPIAVLGAETPRRDLGLIYAKRGEPKIRYEMGGSVPGPMNTSVTGMVRPDQNAKEDTGMLSPEDIQQIVEAMRPTIIDIVQSELGGAGDAGTGELPEDDIEGGEAQPIDDMPPADEGGEEMPPMDGEPDGDESDDEGKALFSKMSSKYGLGSEKEDLSGARQYMASMSDSQRASVERYCGCEGRGKEKALYEKCCTQPVERMQKARAEGEVAKYRKAAEDAKADLAKLQRRYSKLREDLSSAQDEQIELRRQVRYSKYDSRLASLEAEGYSFDRKDELETCLGLTDDLAEKHLTKIAQHYAKMPSGTLRVDTETSVESPSQRYAKHASSATTELRNQTGKDVRYSDVLRYMVDHRSSTTPTLKDLGIE